MASSSIVRASLSSILEVFYFIILIYFRRFAADTSPVEP
jgi:hypothetical protein